MTYTVHPTIDLPYELKSIFAGDGPLAVGVSAEEAVAAVEAVKGYAFIVDDESGDTVDPRELA